MPPSQLDRIESAYLRLVFEQVPGAVWATDRDLRFTFMVGGSPMRDVPHFDQLVGTTVYDLVGSHDPTEPLVAHHLDALTGRRQAFDYSRGNRVFELSIEPLRDKSGAVVGSVAAAIDISDRRQTRERLTQTEARLAEAQRMAHVGSFEWDVVSDLVTWSDEMQRIHGMKDAPSAAPIEVFFSQIHADDQARVRAVLFDAYRHPAPFTCEHRIVRADGEVRFLRFAGDVSVNDAGAATRIVGSSWDTTEQHETLHKLEESLSLLRATLDSTADGILVVDSHRRVSASNQRFRTIWGVPAPLMERGNERELLTYVSDQVDDPRAFADGVHELYDSPDRETLDVIHFRDGRVVERFSQAQRVNGTAVGRVWSFRDITERERLLRRATFLAEAARLLSSLDIDKALDGVARLSVPYLGERCAIDLIADRAPRRVVTIDGEEGADTVLNLHPSVLEGHSVIYSAGGRSHLGVPMMSRDAVVAALTIAASRDRNYTETDRELADELARRIALSIDNARLYEAARDALAARDEFLAVAAHELRGPLTSLRLAVQGLSKGALPPEATRKALNVIQREDRRLAEFIDNLVDLGRIRTGQLDFTLEDVDLGSVVRDVVSRYSAESAETGSTVTVGTQGDLKGQWDRTRLEQVVGNLLSNALKYGNRQPIEIEAVGSADRVRLTVTDHGVGIPPEQIDTIFDPYRRSKGTRHYGGLGLGLHIVRTIVDGLGGKIMVSSRPGTDTTFEVNLPRARSQG